MADSSSSLVKVRAMNEKTLLTLLSQTINQIIDRTVSHSWIDKEKEELSTHLADLAWNSLILMIRNCLANGKQATIEELGTFSFVNSEVTFHPTASLLEGAALTMTLPEGHQFLARQAVSYLQEALRIIDSIPTDVKVPAERQSRKQHPGPYQEVELPTPLAFMEQNEFLVDYLASISMLLRQQQLRLTPLGKGIPFEGGLNPRVGRGFGFVPMSDPPEEGLAHTKTKSP